MSVPGDGTPNGMYVVVVVVVGAGAGAGVGAAPESGFGPGACANATPLKLQTASARTRPLLIGCPRQFAANSARWHAPRLGRRACPANESRAAYRGHRAV